MGRLKGDVSSAVITASAYNGKGQCTRMPSQDKLNPAAKVDSYPVVDLYRFVWVWPGDPALADPGARARHALE